MIKTINEFNEQVLNIKNQLQTVYDSFKEDGKEIISKFFQEFLKNNPEIYGVCWTQYTPYFCDGDACEFGVNEFVCYDYADYKNNEFQYPYEDTQFVPSPPDKWKTIEDYNQELEKVSHIEESRRYQLKENIKSFKSHFRNIDHNLLKTVFGDHVWIGFNLTDGLIVEDFQHD